MIPLFKAPMSARVPRAAARVIAGGVLDRGDKVEEFEVAVGDKIGNPWLAAVDNYLSGLRLALRLAAGEYHHGGADEGEVLCVPLAAAETTSLVLASGFAVKWVDIDPDTLSIDLDDLARKISPKTRAVVVSHFLGSPVDLDRLGDVLDEANRAFGVRPAVVEDAAHAWGATFHNKPVGGHGNISVFSFSEMDLLSCGAGGALALPDEESHQRAKLLRALGIDRSADWTLDPPNAAEWGHDCPMNDLNAAIGLANIAEADRAVEAHRENADYFDRELGDVVGLDLVRRAADQQPSFWSYPVKVDDPVGFMRQLASAGIAAATVGEPGETRARVRDRRVLLPGFDRVSERVVCIPVGWWITEEQRHHIVDTIRSGW